MLYYNIGAAGMPRACRCGASVGMKWFRSNIKHGSRLALLALALQFGLSCGHSHASTQETPTVRSVAAQFDITTAPVPNDPVDHAARQTPSHNETDQHPADACAICAVLALASTVLFATPPILLLPQAIELLHLATDAEFIHLNSARVAFQPRAPPLS